MTQSRPQAELAAGTWTLDPAASSIGFRVKLILGLKVTGSFTRYDCAVVVGPSAAESSVTVTVYTNSVATGKAKRDEHLRAESMIAPDSFPTLHFQSTAIAETASGLSITGDLQIRGITHSVVLDAVRSPGSAQPRYTAELVILPKDYGITRRGVGTKPLTVLIDATLKQA